MSLITRRNFISTAACATAATLVPPFALGAEKKKWNMRMSASSICFQSMSIELACKKIAQLGFEAIDIWAPFAQCNHLEDVKERLGAEGLMTLLNKYKLKISAFSVYKAGYEPYAKLLGDMGGAVAIRGSMRGLPKPGELTSSMKKFIESLKPLIELAEMNNSYLAIENHGNALLHTMDSLKAFVDNNTHKHLGIALAPLHLQKLEANIPEAIKIVDKQLFFFYAWQLAGGINQMPGHGPADFTPWLKALAEIKYKRFVNPFMHHEPEPDEMTDAFIKSRKYLLSSYKKAIG